MNPSEIVIDIVVRVSNVLGKPFRTCYDYVVLEMVATKQKLFRVGREGNSVLEAYTNESINYGATLNAKVEQEKTRQQARQKLSKTPCRLEG